MSAMHLKCNAYFTLRCLFALSIVAVTHGARILGFFPSQSKSNLLVHCSIAAELAANGHNVTVIGTMPNVYPDAQYKYIELQVPSIDPAYMKKSVQEGLPIYRQYYPLMKVVTLLGANILEQPQMKHIMKSAHVSDFDLLIVGYFLNDFHIGLASLYECPIIVSATVRPTFAINRMVGNPFEQSYVQSALTDYSQPMDFLERVWNFLITCYERIILNYLMDRQMEKYFCAYFNCDKVSLRQMRENISLVFVNHYFSQGPIRPNVPTMIEIGGVQIPEQVSPLPADIAAHLDNAVDGAILVSFGSNIECKALPYDKAIIMFEIFAKLKQRILWKWSGCPTPGQSPNILYTGWFPQNDVLVHPNLRLFITHGGMSSVTESLYHGIPMLGLPFFGDQRGNLEAVRRQGYGSWFNYNTMTIEQLEFEINSTLFNMSMLQQARKLSRIYRDRPLTARQTVNFWVDYILRHGGAKHMRSPAIDMYEYELIGLDVIGYLLTATILPVVLLLWLTKLMRSKRLKKEVRDKSVDLLAKDNVKQRTN